MGLLTSIFRLPTKQYLSKETIPNGKYLDKDGYNHIKVYLAYYDNEEYLSNGRYEENMIDNFVTGFYSAPSRDSHQAWEAAHQPAAYIGGLKEFIVPEGIRRIGKRAFAYNLNLARIDLPDGLEVIDDEAFLSCDKLSQVVIPASITYIGKGAFDRCVNQLSVLSSNPPEISSLGVGPRCKIFVPKGCIDEYTSNRQWRKYSKQIFEL